MDLGITAAIATVIVALLGLVGVLVGHAYTRIDRLEKAHESLGRDNHNLWLWARSLVDYGYTWRRPEAPQMPTLEDTIEKYREKP